MTIVEDCSQSLMDSIVPDTAKLVLSCIHKLRVSCV